MIKGFFAVAILVTLGWLGSFYYRRYEVRAVKQELHTEIAALRTYEEGYALRNDHYLLLPDSCKSPSVAGWRQLGVAIPPKSKGCFRVESRPTAYALSASATTSTSILIVGSSPDGKIIGSESNDDKSPRWTAPGGSPLAE